MTRRLAAVALAASLAGASASVTAAGRYDPTLRFRVRTTAHFSIYYHAGEERLAARLAGIAESVYVEMTRRLGRIVGRTHVVLVDQSDLSNGWATPWPYNTIEITAVPPAGESLIGNTDDWLRLVFTHEFAHIVHLDRSRGVFAGIRRVLGRAWYVFPNAYLPTWQVEGLATYYESALTPGGRIRTGDFRVLLDEHVRVAGPAPLDRANASLIGWPAGAAPYLFGAYFHDHLARTYGERSLAVLADRTAGRLPYTSGPLFRAEYGVDLDGLWRRFQLESANAAAAGSNSGPPVAAGEPAPPRGSAPQLLAAPGSHPAAITGAAHLPGQATNDPTRPAGDGHPLPRRVTHLGFVVAGPRWHPGGSLLLYSARNPHGFPSILGSRMDGSPPVELLTRFLGDRLAVGRDTVFFDQIEVVRNTSLRSDLYRASIRTGGGGPRTGPPVRLTRQARAMEPDLSPDGRTLACVIVESGGRALALLPVDPETGRAAGPLEVIASEPETSFAAPRWSPDGKRIAVERRRLRQPPEIVLVDPVHRDTRVVVSGGGARVTSPTWMPDGATLLVASDRGGAPFNLYAIDLETMTAYRVTETAGGARSPDVSPDGREVAFVGYTVAGYDIFVMPLDRSTWRQVDGFAPDQGAQDMKSGPTQADLTAGTAVLAAVDSGSAGPGMGGTRLPAGQAADAGMSRPYTPWATLRPRAWYPLFSYDSSETRYGASVRVLDVLGRHAIAVRTEWTTDTGRPGWSAAYVYTRWRPTWFVSVANDASVYEPRFRELEGLAGVAYPINRARYSHSLLGALHVDRGYGSCGPPVCDEPAVESRRRHAIRLGWTFTTAKTYGYSVSAEEGVTLALTSEHVRQGLGADGDADAATAEVRAYRRLGGRHAVLAVRGSAAVSGGDAVVARRFGLGGSGPQTPLLDYGRDGLGLLRGFEPGSVVGGRLAVVNVDYRRPLVWIERGHGLWPLFARSLHGAVFADVGHAWDHAFALADAKSAAGVELSLDAVVGYSVPLTLTAGGAWRHDGTRRREDGLAFYFRVGRAF